MIDKLCIQAEGSDTIELRDAGSSVEISIEAPWAGSAEEGFGRVAAAYLDQAMVDSLLTWLNTWRAK